MLLVQITNVEMIPKDFLGKYGILYQEGPSQIVTLTGRVGNRGSLSQRVTEENYTIIGEVTEIGVYPTEQVTCLDDLKDGDEIEYRSYANLKVIFCKGLNRLVNKDGSFSLNDFSQDLTYSRFDSYDIMKVIRKGKVVYNRLRDEVRAELEQAVLDLQLASQVRDIQDEKIDKLKTDIKELQYELDH